MRLFPGAGQYVRQKVLIIAERPVRRWGILRLTVVTIFGLIGTVATGFLGMNLLSESQEPFAWRLVLFLLVLAGTGTVTLYSVVKSKVLADFLDALSDERVSWPNKWRVLRRLRQ